MNLENICKNATDIIIETGNYIRSEGQGLAMEQIAVKGLHNYVTYVDKNSEKMLVKGLERILPEAGFIVEEETIVKKGQEYNWIIDPLDGTTNFIHQAPPFAISVALAKGETVVMGIVYEVVKDECFYAWENGKAYLNGNPIQCSDTQNISGSLIATGFPYTDFQRLEPFLETMRFFMKNSHGLRRLGSAATDLAYVACGRYDAFYEYGLNSWDVAAGSFIVQQAGGMNSDFNGDKNYIFGKEIITSNSDIHADLVKEIGRMMKQ
jgi:myo-inositol-1(or 4)-monophosphatase